MPLNLAADAQAFVSQLFTGLGQGAIVFVALLGAFCVVRAVMTR